MKRAGKARKDELLREYDFTKGRRGKYARRFAKGANLVALAPDIAKVFPDLQAVNEALRTLARVGVRNRKKSSA